MLEIRELVKTYHTKGEDVRAIDGVSLTFDETGLVFLLGKSGSGKSTLLNLCGGLDEPDSGEIVIDGKSSSRFTASDFDSYRNTFVGFVFQEFNLLDEFTVGDNVALALELQGKDKKKNRTLIDEILAQVDLAGYAKRKPGTLSGGQKQRVAIARALVKDPRIILADEPTGSLDAATGEQVLETLKKLSKTKLVIIVSHDRDFAERYGDRIIELSDGRVISDVYCRAETPAALNEADSKNNAACNADSETGQKGPTQRESRRHAGQKRTKNGMIRSSLPLTHALRIGAGSIKGKPFRLFFTVLLSVIAFTLFGVFSTLTFYNENEVIAQTYLASEADYVVMQNNYRYTTIIYHGQQEEHRTQSSNATKYTPDDLARYRADYGGSTAGVYAPRYTITIENILPLVGDAHPYYARSLGGFVELGQDTSFWESLLLTDTDLSALGEDGIVIPSYVFDCLKQYAMVRADNSAQVITLETYDDIVGQTLALTSSINSSRSIYLTICGVYRADLPQKYDYLKDSFNCFVASDEELAALRAEITYGGRQFALVSEQFYGAHGSDFDNTRPDYGFRYLDNSALVYLGEATGYDCESAAYAAPMPVRAEYVVPNTICFFDGVKRTTLADGETIVPFALIEDVVWEAIEEEYAATQDDDWLDEMRRHFEILSEGRYYEYDWALTYEHTATEQELSDAVEALLSFLENSDRPEDLVPMQMRLEVTRTGREPYPYGTMKIVGFFYGRMNMENSESYYFSPAQYEEIVQLSSDAPPSGGWVTEVTETNYIRPEDAVYSYIAIPMPDTAHALRTLLDRESLTDENDTFASYISVFNATMDDVDQLIGTLSPIFLWAGVIMAVFAVLLLFNFISASVTHKRKEIGILRALGCRSPDVFKIFYAEAGIIAVACFVLAMIASAVLCYVLNNLFAETVGVVIFIFGPPSWLVLLAISVVTSVLGTFLPVFRIARRRPVDSIRAK